MIIEQIFTTAARTRDCAAVPATRLRGDDS